MMSPGDPWRLDYEPFPRPSGRAQIKIRLSPIKFLTALLLNHPELAEHVDDIEILDGRADADMALFLRVLQVVQTTPSTNPRISLPTGWAPMAIPGEPKYCNHWPPANSTSHPRALAAMIIRSFVTP